LPSSWTIRYELAQIDEEILLAKIADGTITPQLKRAEVERKVLGKVKSAGAVKRLDTIKSLNHRIKELEDRNKELEAHNEELEAARDLSQPEETGAPVVAFNRRGLRKPDGTSITTGYGVTPKSHPLTLASHARLPRPWSLPAGPGPGQAPGIKDSRARAVISCLNSVPWHGRGR
jgi:hypothetical protein